MTAGFFNSFFSRAGSSKSGSDYLDRKRREDQRKQAYAAGRPDVFEKLPFMRAGKDPWTLERKERREETRKQYFKEKERLRSKKILADRELERKLEHQKEKIDRYYRLHELPPEDPRYQRAARMAQMKFQQIANRERQEHHRQWQDNYRQLRSGKDRDYHEITKGMKREYREARGLPDRIVTPWNLNT